MRDKSTRREFLKRVPYSAAGLFAGGIALPNVFGQQPMTPRNPIPLRLPPVQQIQTVGMMRNFNMITLGDSIMWGQGLPDNPRIPGGNNPSFKFRDLVQDWLQAQFGNSRTVKQWPTRAHSGAQIFVGNGEGDAVTNLPGELPSDLPSVHLQVELSATDLIQAGVNLNDVDLVLLNGGANDISIENVLNVTKMEGLNGPNWVRTQTNQLSVAHMKSVLPQVMGTFPNAAIIVTGYYPPVSNSTDLVLLYAYLQALGVPISLVGAITGLGPDPLADIDAIMAASMAVSPLVKAALIDRSNAFAQTAFNGFTDAVSQSNQGLASPRVALAWPAFSDDNCYGAPNTYLFLLGQYLTDEKRGREWKAPPGDWSTEQGIAYYRAEGCSRFQPSSPLCYDASVGHPNERGAQAYAKAITQVLLSEFGPRFGFHPPPTMNLKIAQSGTEVLPRRAPANGSQTWHWVVVSAADSQSGAPISGASVVVNSPGGDQSGPLGLPYHWYSGPVGQKIYYICETKTVLPAGRTGGPHNPGPITIPCTLSVSAPGYEAQGIRLP